LAGAASSEGLSVAAEGFADRAYRKDAALVPRGHPGAVIHDPAEAAARAVQMVTEGTVEAITGETIDLRIDTLCVHGDTPNAPAIAQSLRRALEAAGVAIARLATP